MIVCPVCSTSPDSHKRHSSCRCGRFVAAGDVWTFWPIHTGPSPMLQVTPNGLLHAAEIASLGDDQIVNSILEEDRPAVVASFVELALADSVLES